MLTCCPGQAHAGHIMTMQEWQREKKAEHRPQTELPHVQLPILFVMLRSDFDFLEEHRLRARRTGEPDDSQGKME